MAGGALAAEAMTVTMRAESITAKTAIEGTAIKPSPRVQRRLTSGGTTFARYKTHRYRAHGRGAHHRKDDAARSFCLIVLGHGDPSRPFRHARRIQASAGRSFHGIVRRGLSAAARKMRGDGLGEA